MERPQVLCCDVDLTRRLDSNGNTALLSKMYVQLKRRNRPGIYMLFIPTLNNGFLFFASRNRILVSVKLSRAHLYGDFCLCSVPVPRCFFSFLSGFPGRPKVPWKGEESEVRLVLSLHLVPCALYILSHKNLQMFLDTVQVFASAYIFRPAEN